MKKKVRVKDSYVKGLLAAEQLYKDGYYLIHLLPTYNKESV